MQVTASLLEIWVYFCVLPWKLPVKSMTPLEFWTACSSNGIVLDKPQVDTLERYHDELVYWNQRVNMISRKDDSNVWERHIFHSLTLLTSVDIKQKARVLDVGTGGGLPGIPVKVARPDIKITLVDSIKKKATMTEMFAAHTALKDITVLNARAEELAAQPQYRKSFDVVISRAVARTGTVLSWVTDVVKPNCICAFLKGGDLTEELAEAREMHPSWTITEQPIRVFGHPWFEENAKKVVLCKHG
jgi:16S rRNA (guanine527-N7)-methyltransferase